MVKDLIVNLSIGVEHDAAIPYAVSLAETLGAHATGVAFAYEPVVVATVMGGGMPIEYIEAQRAESEQAAKAAQEKFDKAARLAGISSDSNVFASSVAGGADQFGRMARTYDLSVVMQADPDKAGPEELIAEAALFQSGRPVMIVPYINKGGLVTDRIMVCWDGGRTSARAIADALPLLKRAKAVEVVTITGEEGKGIVPGADIGRHLARHAVQVEVKRIVATGNVQTTLLSYAADISADMIVMGGYGHSRLREFILGGVTRGMLASMTVPCLMSH